MRTFFSLFIVLTIIYSTQQCSLCQCNNPLTTIPTSTETQLIFYCKNHNLKNKQTSIKYEFILILVLGILLIQFSLLIYFRNFQFRVLKFLKYQKKTKLNYCSNPIFKFLLLFIYLPTLVFSQSTSNGCQQINKIVAHQNNIISALQISYDDSILASAANDQKLKFWSLSNLNTQHTINSVSQFQANNVIDQTDVNSQYSGLDLSNTNNSLAVIAGSSKNIILLNITNIQTPSVVLNIPAGFLLNSAVLTNSGNRLIISGTNIATPPQSSTLIYDFNGTAWNNATDISNNFYLYNALGEIISKNNSRLVILQSPGLNILNLNPLSNTYETIYQGKQSAVRAILSNDESILMYFQTQGSQLKILNYNLLMNSYLLAQTISDNSGGIKDIYLSPDNMRLVLVQDDSSVNIYQYNNFTSIYVKTQIMSLDSDGEAYVVNSNSLGTHLFVGDSKGNIYSYQCCASIYQNITNNCACNDGYKKNGAKCQCSKDYFDPTNHCSTCITGYYLDSNICKACNTTMTNCKYCSTDGSSCDTCFLGYFISNNNCQACGNNCNICDDNTKCLVCSIGYVNSSSGNCVTNVGCISNDENYACITCDNGYYLDPTTTLCNLCNQIKGCLTCLSSSTCLSCNYQKNYKLVLNKADGSTYCVCKAGFYADSTNNCISCTVYGCSNCDITDKCYSCAVGYYFDNSTKLCCTAPNCANCQNNGVCTLCATNYFMNKNNTCQSNSDIKNCKNYTTNGCSTCMVSFYLDTQNYCCSSQFCLNCTLNNSTCQTCLANYYADQSGNCCTVENCANCSASQSNCTACKSGYYLNQSGMCSSQSTIKFCTTYNASGCQICNTNYFVDSNNYCCLSNNCASCSLSSPTCLNCALNYTLDTFGNCCNTTNCSTCNATTAICSLCVTGFYLDSNHSCQNTSNILNCLTYGANGCTECNSSYNLYVDYCCITTNCAQCLINSTCVNCQSGYFLSIDQFCVNTDNCNITYSGICLNCSINYFLNTNNSCVAYSTVPKCINFDSFGCTACQSGYYLDSNNYCTTSPNCSQSYQQNQLCQICLTNYYLNSTNNLCILMNISNCLVYGINGCNICQTGYNVLNNICCSSTLIGCKACNSQQTQICTNCSSPYQLALNNTCVCQIGYQQTTNGSCIIHINNPNPPTVTPSQTAQAFTVTASLTTTDNSTLNISQIQQKATAYAIVNQNRRKLTEVIIKLDIKSIKLFPNNQVQFQISNPTIDLKDAILRLSINAENIQEKQIEFKIQILYSSQSMSSITTQNITSEILISFVLIIMLVFFILGYKHNHTINFIQKISVLRFSLNIVNTNFSFMYNLRYSYYAYGYNPLQNILSSNYLEHSKGYFYLIDLDANILRNVGIPILLSICTLTLKFLGFCFFKKQNQNQNQQQNNQQHRPSIYQKIYYRTIQFIERTIMFPIIFFSIAQLSFAKLYGISSSADSKTYNASIAFSIIYILYFGVLGALAFFNSKLCKYSKIEIIGQYLFDILDSVIIITTIQSKNVLVLILMILTKGLFQMYIKNSFIRKISRIDFVKTLNICLQIAIIGILVAGGIISAIHILFSLIIVFDMIYIIVLLLSKKVQRVRLEREQTQIIVEQEKRRNMGDGTVKMIIPKHKAIE